MRHRVYSKDAAERTVPQRQENMGKAAVVGRWAERELVKDETRREETRKEREVERKKKERRKQGRKEGKSKKGRERRERSEETERKHKKGNSTDNWKENRSVRNSITPWRRWLPKREGTHEVGRISKG